MEFGERCSVTIQLFGITHFAGREDCKACNLSFWEKLERHECGGYLHSEAHDECSVCGSMIYWDFCDECGYAGENHYEHDTP